MEIWAFPAENTSFPTHSALEALYEISTKVISNYSEKNYRETKYVRYGSRLEHGTPSVMSFKQI